MRDAEKCAEAGAKGIVVSHHHGIIDYAVPPLMILPDIVEAVGDEMPVFLDCGIANASDVFKALALGATAVCVGRGILDSVRQGGADGAADWLRQTTQALAGIMARTGSPDIRGIDPEVLWEG